MANLSNYACTSNASTASILESHINGGSEQGQVCFIYSHCSMFLVSCCIPVQQIPIFVKNVAKEMG